MVIRYLVTIWVFWYLYMSIYSDIQIPRIACTDVITA